MQPLKPDGNNEHGQSSSSQQQNKQTIGYLRRDFVEAVQRATEDRDKGNQNHQ